MHDVAVFANPIAGRGKAKHLLETISQGLRQSGLGVRPILQQAQRLSDKELAEVRGCHAIVVIGGDGTLRQVVDRIIQDTPRHPPFLMVPMGTANLMAQYLGLKWEKDTVGTEVAETIRRYKTIEIDSAIARNREHPDHGELMLLVAGVGIDGKIVHELSRLRRGPITKLSYALPAALALSQYRFPRIRVRVDDRPIYSGHGIALVGNVKEYGTGFPVLPHARPDDGVLDVCALPCTHPGELFKLFLAAASGEHLEQEGVVYVKGKAIAIESDEPAPVQVDGEAAGFTPIGIEVMQTRVRFLVP
jgi:diacylglycerol kinase (ATP)